MKSESQTIQPYYRRYLFRVIIKFKHAGNHAIGKVSRRNVYAAKRYQRYIETICSDLPGTRIDKLFNTLHQRRIFHLAHKAKDADNAYDPPEFSSYHALSCLAETNYTNLLANLLKYETVELAYLQIAPRYPPSVYSINSNSDFQGYLHAAPRGVDAKYAWNVKGGDGKGNITFIDIEQGWLMTHEAFSVNPITGTGINHQMRADHGAAVLGIIMMNATHGKGIVPGVRGYVVSQWRPDGAFNSADAIMTAINHLRFGDILLLESQTADPSLSDQVWPVEIEEATFQAIRLATALGVIVIEAAGNGTAAGVSGNDLDEFHTNEKKIFNPLTSDFRDSGAIIVAAATAKLPHGRMRYSNYGKRINCYAWGENVYTAGSHPKSSGYMSNKYTGCFGGTSSAAAIIAGTAIALQNVAEINYGFRLSPAQMRSMLSSDLWGTASEKGRAIDKIGVMPDLKKLIDEGLKCVKR